MDIFSVGCVIAELFLEGQPLFELSQLLAYRRGQFDPSQHLEKIPDSGIRKMILHMIQLDPDSRCSADWYLQSYAGVVLPCYFSPFLHNLYSNLNPITPDSRVAMCQLSFPEILKQMLNNKVEDVHLSENSSNHKQGKLLQTISNVFKRNHHPFLREITMKDLTSLMSDYDNQSDTFGMPFLPLPQDNTSCEGMVLIASLLCSCIRNVKMPQLRRSAVLLLKSCSLYIDDEDRLQRVLPYVIAMLSDSSAIVRSAALETLCDILPLVRDFPPSDAKIFPEYILPMLSMLPDDPEESVRICYASNISKLALTAYGFLIHSISLTEAGVLNDLSLNQKSQKITGKNDAQLAQLRKSIAEVIQELVMGPKQTPNIRRALLQDVGNLCWFFGQRQSNDFLLPILPAFLNDQDELLRSVFYHQIIYVCFFVGQRSVEEYLLPYLEQALDDSTEGVIVNALDCLAILCTSGFLRKRILLEMIEHAFPLLCYPSQWVRRSAVKFIAASSETLGAVDSYVFLVPLIRPFLRRQPSSLASENALFSCLKPPVSRQVFYQILENNKSSDMLERQRKIWYNSSQTKQSEIDDVYQKGVRELDQMKMWTDRKPVNSSTMQSFSGSVDILDPLFSDKLKFSGFMSPQISGANSLVGEKSSEGIPLYYFKYDNKKASSAPPESSLQLDAFGSSSLSMTTQKDPVNSPPQLHRVVHESEDREPDQTTRISTNFQELGISNSLNDNSSPTDTSVLPSFGGTHVIPDSGWRPRGVLVAHLQEHRSAVNDIAVSTDNSFFVTASDDSTVRIWDSRKLEKDISFRSRLTYGLKGSRALCATMLQSSTQVVVGASDGKLHMFSVDYISRGIGTVVEKYNGFVDEKMVDVKEGAIITVLNYSSGSGDDGKMVLYSTQNCGIHLRDTRENSNSWNTKVTPEEGYVSALVTSPCGNWFVSGSSRGVLTLWDLRFGIPVNSWQYSVACPISDMCLFVPPQSTSLSTTVRPLVYVAAGCNEVSLWNAENGSCHQVLRVANSENDAEISDHTWALARPSSKTSSKGDSRRSVNSKYRVDELNEPLPRLPGIRSLLPLPGGDLLTGGTDLKIRRWDHCSPERTYCICGPSIKGVGNDEFYETKSSFGVQIVQEAKRRPLATRPTGKAVIAAAATDSGGCHRDSILSLASVKLNQRLLLSSSRDGTVKVWK
ncbi:serine/threonine-protein kinase VPS15 isoform X1 [Rutidosis leptorrhynchoides]